MITPIPVARWTWGRDHDSADTIGLCIQDLLKACSVLIANHLMPKRVAILIRISEAGQPRNWLFRKKLVVDLFAPMEEVASQLTDSIRAGRAAGEIGSVMTSVEYDKIDEHNHEFIGENLLQLTTDAYRDYVTTSVETFSDSWMQFNLMGRAQPEIYSVNQKRLAAVLKAMSEVLGSDTDPGDPTDFGTPTETGIENYFERDGNPSNVWAQHES